jgi:uncharacterized membrane protein
LSTCRPVLPEGLGFRKVQTVMQTRKASHLLWEVTGFSFDTRRVGRKTNRLAGTMNPDTPIDQQKGRSGSSVPS